MEILCGRGCGPGWVDCTSTLPEQILSLSTTSVGQYLRPVQRSVEESMEIRVHSRLILARYNGCTNARCILSRSYGREQFKNANPFSVQKAHKAVRAGPYLRPLQRRIVPSMEIRIHSRLILARYKGCTNARCILSRSYGHEEFKNVNPFSVQKAYTNFHRLLYTARQGTEILAGPYSFVRLLHRERVYIFKLFLPIAS